MPENEASRRNPVRVLRDSVARRIAAGEVIERPASVVRELLDNALDAEAREISLHVEGGGIDRIHLTDDGNGMTEEDLRLCWLPHATSKIETEEDLYRVRSLGFRGEALAAISTVARTEITSMPRESSEAFKLIVHGGGFVSLEPSRGKPGTVVDVSDLFYAIPARRRFLKRPSAETAQCRAVFLEKALPFPGVAFRLFTDGTLRQFLPPADLAGRVAAAFGGDLDPRLLRSLKGAGGGFSVEIVAATPDLPKKDRRYLQIYVNRRRIWEFTLSQGVEYAYSGCLPGGLFPACFVFIEIDPSLADFNIHPAKKEAKIRNLQDLRRKITDLLGSFLRETVRLNVSPARSFTESRGPALFDGGEAGSDPAGAPGGALTSERTGPMTGAAYSSLVRSSGRPGADLHLREVPLPGRHDGETSSADFIYRGRVFDLFLLAERGDRLYLVDQHAAHERILYDAFAEDRAAQRLLVPEEFDTDDETDPVVEENAETLHELGMEFERLGPRRWALAALPAVYRGAEGDIIEAAQASYGAADVLKKDIFARAACRKAIKDGDVISPSRACELIAKVFLLDNPRCPHGRPLWTEVTREDLFRKVQRIF